MKLSKEDEQFIKTVLEGHELEELEAKLKPGYSNYEDDDEDDFYGSDAGFIGKDESFVGILLEDKKTLEKYNVTYEELADAVADLIDASKWEKHGKDYMCGDFRVSKTMTMGSQECPWGCPDEEPYISSCMIFVEKKETMEETKKIVLEKIKSSKAPSIEHMFKSEYNLLLTEMSPHLIRDHKFFEGKGTPYRMEPETLIEWLGLTKKE